MATKILSNNEGVALPTPDELHDGSMNANILRWWIAALTTWFYHSTELHNATFDPNRLIMVSWTEDSSQQRVGIGAGMVSLFNSGCNAPQVQIEINRTLRFTPSEMTTQLSWDLAFKMGGNIVSEVATFFSWEEGWMWTYNMPINVCSIQQKGTTLIDNVNITQCLQYAGTHRLFTTSGLCLPNRSCMTHWGACTT